ncbi:Asp23/Gls24 family envelope stress response protein [Actinokineospora diospyrosa]|uniref:Asp23/Gls24 family envelope stress response protein n=1 Tax=Actinokineospora diospyrosa TaxID=103728 RepID=UPI0020A3DB16|nr:Asp23/Gls24 family envelope stress response protein [Actinokineospora diospyrosa]
MTPATGIRPRTPETTDPAGRGSLTIADGVVAKIAARAATEVHGVGGSAHRLLGVEVGARRGVQVHATVTGTAVALDVRLSIEYPMSVRRVVGDVREHLARRIRVLTGLAVSGVEVTVTALRSATPAAGRVR